MFTPAFARDGECASPGAFLRTPAMAPLTTPTPRRAFHPQPRVFRRDDADTIARRASRPPTPRTRMRSGTRPRPRNRTRRRATARFSTSASRATTDARLARRTSRDAERAQHTLATVDEDAESLGAARRTLFDPHVSRRVDDRDEDSDDDRDDDTRRLPARPSPRKRPAASSRLDDSLEVSPEVSVDDLREEDVSPDTVLGICRSVASKMDVASKIVVAPRSPFKAARSSLAQSSPRKRDDVARRNAATDDRACAPGARAGAAGKPSSRTASRVLRLLTRGDEESRASGAPIRLPASRLEDRFAALELARERVRVRAVEEETAARGGRAQPRW